MTAMRRERGWSAQKLATAMTAAGMPWTGDVVAGAECGRRRAVTVDELVALASVFEVGIGALLGQPSVDLLADQRARGVLEEIAKLLAASQ